MPFLMTWKPEGWAYENIQKMLIEYEANGSVTESWRISAYNQTTVGDRVWLLRQGNRKRGIFGMGEIAGEPALRDYQGSSRMMVPVRFLRLTDPEKKLLIRHGELKGILEDTQIATRSSGITLGAEQSVALEALLPADYREREGTEWSAEEVESLVADYFAMLREEINARPYSKANHRRSLMRYVRRSEGAIERKHQNVSAVLHKLGFRWINGYKPLGNAQTELTPEVEKHLKVVAKELDKTTPEVPEIRPLDEVFVAPPKDSKEDTSSDVFEAIARKFDVAKRDARNKALGDSGEEYVVALEERRLKARGLTEKVGPVIWVARKQGDGLGYDIRSFADDGTEIFIEVKTTRGDIHAPFFLTERERAVAAKKGEQYRLYRVFAFGREPKIYVIRGPLETQLNLKPTAYRVTVRPPEVL